MILFAIYAVMLLAVLESVLSSKKFIFCLVNHPKKGDILQEFKNYLAIFKLGVAAVLESSI